MLNLGNDIDRCIHVYCHGTSHSIVMECQEESSKWRDNQVGITHCSGSWEMMAKPTIRLFTKTGCGYRKRSSSSTRMPVRYMVTYAYPRYLLQRVVNGNWPDLRF